VRCFTCPAAHEGWHKADTRRRKGVAYCLEHLPPKADIWPCCPKCGGKEFGQFAWKGSVEKTTITCEKCGFKDLAVNHFDALTVKVIASPVGEAK